MRIFTDGACSGNPGPGGYAVVVEPFVIGNPVEFYSTGRDSHTTNNIMELMAATDAMNIAGCLIDNLPGFKHKYPCEIITDSKYVVNGWNGTWKIKTNLDIWDQFWAQLGALDHIDFQFKWVKGHAGNKLNELADELARLSINMFIKSTI